MREQFIEARRRGVPLIAITTSDQPDLTVRLAQVSSSVPCVCWDAVRGLFGVNPAGTEACSLVLGDASPAMFTDAPAALDVASTLPKETVLIVQGAHRLLSDARCAQAILNLRDPYAGTRRCLVLLGPSFTWPSEIGSDVLVIDDPLPTERQRAGMITEVATSAEVKLEDGVLREAVRATRGLSAFVTQQVSALSMQRTGLDLRALRTQWRRSINDTPGLSVDESGTTLDDVAGLQNFKNFCRAVMGGRGAPDTIVRIDEIEKAMGGSTSDSSGVSQAILGGLLTWMQERGATGLIGLGPPGSGKSLCSVAMGAVRGAPTVTLDLGALKGSLVGQSEERIRNALRTLESLAGRTFWIATCNSLSSLPPELRRRFGFGVWFFDLPTEEERDAMWKMYAARYGVPDERPADAGWTGAEIKSACEFAYQLGITPRQAAQWIVPVSRSSPEVIDELRRRASGRFMSASYPGPYNYKDGGADVAVAVVRRFELGATPDKEKN